MRSVTYYNNYYIVVIQEQYMKAKDRSKPDRHMGRYLTPGDAARRVRFLSKYFHNLAVIFNGDVTMVIKQDSPLEYDPLAPPFYECVAVSRDGFTFSEERKYAYPGTDGRYNGCPDSNKAGGKNVKPNESG